MPASQKSVQAPIALPRAPSAWLISFRVLVLKLASISIAIVSEPWEAAGRLAKAAITRMGEVSKDETILAVENNAMRRHPHVLNAATNLLGICFIIIGGLKLTNQNSRTYSDEIAWAAAFFLVVSIAMSYFGVREGIEREWRVRIADWSFLVGIAALIVSMVIAAYQL